MADSRSFSVGNISGGQVNLGGDHNTFHQGVDPAALAGLIAAVRGRLDDFADPEAASRALTVIEGTAVTGEPTGRERVRRAIQDLKEIVLPGTEAVTAVAALATTLIG